MKAFAVFMFLKFSVVHSIANEAMTIDRFVVETRVYSTAQKTIQNIQSSGECALICSVDHNCCGFTKETSTNNCLLFNNQTLRKCQSKLVGNSPVKFIKQRTDCTELPTDICRNTSGGQLPIDCSELPPDWPSKVYKVYPSRENAVLVYCEMNDAGGGWTVLQRRQNGSVDFYQNWTVYKNGFGNLENEFWLGNDIIHNITSQKHYKVRFDLEDFDNLTAYAEYDNFFVDDESMNYTLNISGYSGTAGDGMYNEGIPVAFSTRDVDNDQHADSCAETKESGWWFRDCARANINGLYKPGDEGNDTMHWRPWKDNEGLTKTRIMIKPV